MSTVRVTLPPLPRSAARPAAVPHRPAADDPELPAAAHEAGHGLAAVVLGGVLHRLELVGPGRGDTVVSWSGMPAGRRLVVALAGVACERASGVRRPDWWCRRSPLATTDYATVRALLRELPRAERRPARRAAMARARGLVRRHAAAVREIAAALLRRRTLTGAEVERVVFKHGG